ncbi:DUF4349 domain-containing protein [Pedobacter heparinus]|uniref:DUF4349 domain-containing protein n=1 Tax=Pedobacter heparinus (strain ATCC 13125 / DSM 2366 / CIP 104194 / JCM 7457 / NBRC 12017 / NCIMB 9290 / NRRL B-14731 / HIM 762-3) TaxID=485917 RepID=C6XZS8_PEDHD|nr:DUF4349 domain-containing protein [Pedobacter heparinus]ACU02623.1 hypothetical protein Phep_0399 [Pedobacter heparinus DSM 2366]
MKSYFVYPVIIFTFWSCSNTNKSYESADVTAANLENADTALTKKIIKTADMRFRVRDVQDTKAQLSAAIKAEGGDIAEFTIQSNIQQTDKVKYSADSLLELTAYRTEGAVTAKIPSDKLDEFTNKVAKMAVFVDFQSMKLDDQSLVYLSNKLKNQNRAEAANQLDKHASKKSNSVGPALGVKDDYVDKKIQNMQIDSRVQYSNITLNFYQDNTVKKMIVANDSLYDYKPDFLRRFVLNIQNGWMIFKEFILILTNLWMLILLLLAGYFTFRYYRKRRAQA